MSTELPEILQDLISANYMRTSMAAVLSKEVLRKVAQQIDSEQNSAKKEFFQGFGVRKTDCLQLANEDAWCIKTARNNKDDLVLSLEINEQVEVVTEFECCARCMIRNFLSTVWNLHSATVNTCAPNPRSPWAQ